MSAFLYTDSVLPIRDDIPRAHRRAWEQIARPGTWWTGAERVAIAAEVRNAELCDLCRKRKHALTPQAVDGDHDSLGVLSDPAVDVVHRVTSDPGQLTKTWFDRTLAIGLSDVKYVELIGVLVRVVGIDQFHRALGLPLEPLPEPQPGNPSRRRPRRARPGSAWVPMLKRASGDEDDLWSGVTGNVIRALSLVPDEVRGLKELSAAHYLGIEEMMDLNAGRALDRAQIELVAGRVSALNNCFY